MLARRQKKSAYVIKEKWNERELLYCICTWKEKGSRGDRCKALTVILATSAFHSIWSCFRIGGDVSWKDLLRQNFLRGGVIWRDVGLSASGRSSFCAPP